MGAAPVDKSHQAPRQGVDETGLHRRADRAWHLGRAAADVARERYTWHAVINEFESVYDEVLGLATVTPESRPDGKASAPAARGHNR